MIEILKDEINKGTGFPYILISSKVIKASNKTDQLLYDSIIENTSYDPQSTGSRHKYLFNILSQYENRTKIIDLVKIYFTNMEDVDYGNEQVCGFICELISTNEFNENDYCNKLIWYINNRNSTDIPGIDPYIELRGLSAIKNLCSIFGEKIINKQNFDVNQRGFLYLAEEYLNKTEEEILDYLRNLEDININAYVDRINLNLYKSHKHRLTVDELITRIETKVYPVSIWLKNASQEDIDFLSNVYQTTKNKQLKQRIISGFNKTRMNISSDFLVHEIQRSRDMKYKIEVLTALTCIDSKSALMIARKISDYNYLLQLSQILIDCGNEIDDYAVIMLYLEQMGDSEIHSIIQTVINSTNIKVFVKYKHILALIFNRNKCSICRYDLIMEMEKLNLFDENNYKCLVHDCNKKISDFAKFHLTTAST